MKFCDKQIMGIKYIQANKIQPTFEDIIGPKKTAAINEMTIIENLQSNRDVMS